MANDISNFFTRLFTKVFNPGPKNRRFENYHVYNSIDEAKIGFDQSREKLFSIQKWSNLKGINSEFKLYHESGRFLTDEEPQKGNFIKIILPGFNEANWVQITGKDSYPDFAQFTVHPSRAPQEKSDPDSPVEHFFKRQSSSTFRITRRGKRIYASEIGMKEEINNEGEDAGDRKLDNSIVGVGGWLAFQKLQWEKLTKWLVHLDEPNS